jgi:bacterioferritin-associated ferredoxin
MNAIDIFGNKTGCHEAFLRRAIVAGLDPQAPPNGSRRNDHGHRNCSRGIAARSLWNHLKRRFFLLHPAVLFNISISVVVASHPGPADFMIVCSCNVITDHDVRGAVSAVVDFPRSAKQVYDCLGCSAECGRCARTIRTIIDEALGGCAKACCSGCPHSRTQTDSHVHGEFALAAS